jgi:aldehyde reductase
MFIRLSRFLLLPPYFLVLHRGTSAFLISCSMDSARRKRKRPSLRSSKRTMHGSSSKFHVTTAAEATSLTDGAGLANGIILPWIGYGTYKLGKTTARESTLEALRQGYRCIDTAFIYGGETTEKQVGLAIQEAIQEGTLDALSDLVIITKHWRKYHGYEPTLECLRLSLKRLQVDSVDLWLMHWPGPAWTTMNRRKDEIQKHGPWVYATHSKEDLPSLRAETWRAMEDSVKAGKVKAIGVSNFSIAHLERLKNTATIWPPAVNQIECHPLYPQTELVEYCAKEGIVVQAYASLGGQDAGKAFWKKLYKPRNKQAVTKLVNAPPVVALANEVRRTPGQVLLRWAMEKNIAVVPKTASIERLIENSKIFDFHLSKEQSDNLDLQLQRALSEAAQAEEAQADSMGRLCWRNDPLRLLDFD